MYYTYSNYTYYDYYYYYYYVNISEAQGEASPSKPAPGGPPPGLLRVALRGNQLSNTTCLTQVSFMAALDK